MVNKRIITIMSFCFYSVMYGTEPQVSSEYYIHDGNNVIYLEMEADEVKELLGEPADIEIYRSDDPFRNIDLICWKYQDLYVFFYDSGTKAIIKIDLPAGGMRFQLGEVKISETEREKIIEIYSEPDYKIETNDCLYYQYYVPPFDIFPITYILQFRFNKDDICDEIIFFTDFL